MKESIAQSFIISLILFFFGILVLLYFGSINYSKAYKAKNRIITTLEKYGSFENNDSNPTKKEIEENLQKGGYQTTSGNTFDKCNKFLDGGILLYPSNDSRRKYDYCIIEYNSGVGKYYRVVTFMKFDIPVIGGFLEFAVKGETKALYDNIVE